MLHGRTATVAPWGSLARPWALLLCAAVRPQQRHAAASAAAALASHEQLSELVLNQRAVISQLNSQRFTIAGVTFEGRQEVVKRLRRNMPILLVPEPSNQYDAKAVAIQLLSGEQLGFVPRTHNGFFTGCGLMPAFVVSAGQAAKSDGTKGPWGALVWSSPSAVPLLPLPLPKALRPSSYSTSGSSAAGDSQQELLKVLVDPSGGPGKEVLRACKHTCELTAVSASKELPVQLVPLWRLDLAQKRVQLLRVVAACGPVAQAFDVLRMTPGEPEYQQARRLVEQFNQWQPEEFEQYVAWAQGQQDRMDSEPWDVNLLLLEAAPAPQAA